MSGKNLLLKCICCLGGGKDLAAAASIQETRESKLKQEDTVVKNEAKPSPMLMGGNSKMMGNMGMGAPYDMMRNQQSELIIFKFGLVTGLTCIVGLF